MSNKFKHIMSLLGLTILAIFALGSSETDEKAAPTVVKVKEELIYPLRVKDVGLGISNAPCSPEEATYVDIIQKPVRVQMQCRFGDRRDQTLVVFSIDSKSVVRVLRTQYLNVSDLEPSEVVGAAVDFYGKPDRYDEGNWLAAYGNAYSVSYSGRRASTQMSNNGIGLLIHGKLCGEERFGMVNCGNLGARVITYDLIDVAGYKKQIKDGEAALLAKQQAEISKQKF